MSSLWPFVVIGLFSGAVYALAAMGLVLTYRTSGIFNFAYGAVAMFCAFTYWQLTVGWGLDRWLSLALILVVVAPLVGLGFERILRPLRVAAAEVQIVVCLGLLALLQALVPILYGGQSRQLPGILPPTTFSLGGSLHVGYDQLGTLLISLTAGVGLWQLLSRTSFGLLSAAVVDNRDLAELSGVRVTRVAQLSWVVSSAFAAVAGILLSASEGLDVYVLVLVVIYAFAPALLGRLRSLPLAFGGGLGLGVVQGVLGRWGASGTVADVESAVPYLALFALLVGFGRRLEEAGNARGSGAGRPGRGGTRRGAMGPGLSLRLRSRTWGALSWAEVGPGAASLVLAVTLPLFLSPSLVGDLTYGVIFACIALTLVVLTGWAGQVSLAQFSFVGIGAVLAGHLSGSHGQWFFPVMVLAGLAAAPVGLLVGLPSLRLSGLFLALATMAFALLMDNLVFSRPGITGGSTGMAVSRPSVAGHSLGGPTAFYFVSLAVLVVFALTSFVIRRGVLGRRLEAVRHSPLAASTLGVDLVATKLAVFGLCAFGAGMAGALFGAMRETVSPSDFAFQSSLELLLLVVVGGRSLISGAVVAGALYAVELLPSTGSTGQYLPLGVAVAVVVVARYPEGLVSFFLSGWRALTEILRPLPASRRAPAGEPAVTP